MLNQHTLDTLRQLKLNGMAEAFEEQLMQPAAQALSFEERLGLLVDREATSRDNRRLKRLLRAARLKYHAGVEDIDYRAGPGGAWTAAGWCRWRPASGFRTNAEFHKIWSAGKRHLTGEAFAVGDPVIWLVNDPIRGIYNGTLGIVRDVVERDDERSLLCDFEGAAHAIPASELFKMSLAYAITTHKVQGSQFERVIIPISESRLLDSVLIYTALTRAQFRVVFVGNR